MANLEQFLSPVEIDYLKSKKPEWRKFNVKKVKLFGSRVLGKGLDGRDIDLHIEMKSCASERDMKLVERPQQVPETGMCVDVVASVWEIERDSRLKNKKNITESIVIWETEC